MHSSMLATVSFNWLRQLRRRKSSANRHILPRSKCTWAIIGQFSLVSQCFGVCQNWVVCSTTCSPNPFIAALRPAAASQPDNSPSVDSHSHCVFVSLTQTCLDLFARISYISCRAKFGPAWFQLICNLFWSSRAVGVLQSFRSTCANDSQLKRI